MIRTCYIKKLNDVKSVRNQTDRENLELKSTTTSNRAFFLYPDSIKGKIYHNEESILRSERLC